MSENVKKINKENEEGKKRISEKNLAIIITAALLVAVLIAAGVIMIIQAVQKDYGFDYLKSDLSKYVELDGSYKDFKIEIDVAKPHEIDADITVLNLIYSDRELNEKFAGSTITSAYTISAGDTVNIWYRGYLLDEEGKEIVVDNMCNFGDAGTYALSIGSNNFVPGFELGLVGLNTGDYSKFEKIIEGEITEDQIAYVTYTIKAASKEEKDQTFKNVRMDLSTDLDAIYGAGFKAKLLEIGFGNKKDIVATLNDKEVLYSDLTINFTTECETNPMVIECYFPYDYSKTDLRNETAYFEVYVEGIVDYICPEFTDEYLTDKIENEEIALTLEKLNEYEGETLVDKYYDFVNKTLDEIYETTYLSLVEDAVWAHYEKISKAKKYPGYVVEEIYEDFMDEMRMQFIASGGQVYSNSTGKYTTYETLETYIPAYLGLPSTQKWQEYITALAEDNTRERLVMFYIMREENLLPSDERLAEEIETIRQEYLDEYIAQYMDYEGKEKDDYSDEEYKELVEECKDELFSFYDEEYFTMRAYMSIFTEIIVDWPDLKVSTLDDRRAYPLDK